MQETQEKTGSVAVPSTATSPRAWLKSLALWCLYVPNLKLLKLLPPRTAVRAARLVAWLHWLLTFVGAQAAARRVIAQTLPQLGTGLSARTILRKYLEVKHHHFAMCVQGTTERGRKFIEKTLINIDYFDRIAAARAGGRGVLLMGFQFGTGRMNGITAQRLFGGDYLELAIRKQTYLNDSLPKLGQRVHGLVEQLERESGINYAYITSGSPPLSVLRHLRKGRLVGLAGDGFSATEFVEVPFLSGTMRFPTGPARLAAMSGAPILPLFGLSEGLEPHRLTICPPIQCADTSQEAVEATVRAYCAVLEEQVRREPWAWWIWHRLQFDRYEDGRPRLKAECVGAPVA